jgi:hypothetical protein
MKIKEKWNFSVISGTYINDVLQIFDGRHRLTALKRFNEEEFKEIFDDKDNKEGTCGVTINIYKDLSPINLLQLSESNFIYLYIRFQ